MADILLLARPTLTGTGGSTPTPAEDADTGLIGGLRRGSAGDANLYTDNNTQVINIGGGSSSTNINLTAGTDLNFDARGMTTPLPLNEASFLDLPSNLSAFSLIRVIHELNKKAVQFMVFAPTASVTTGDGAVYFTVPDTLNGLNLLRAQATVVTAGTGSATTVMVHNFTDTVDMLTGVISIADGATVGTPGTIDTSNDDVATDDILRIDVDSVASTVAPQGLMVVLTFGI